MSKVCYCAGLLGQVPSYFGPIGPRRRPLLTHRGKSSFETIKRGFMKRRLVIVGAGAGGGSVAAEAQRRDPKLEIVMLEQSRYVATAA